MVTTYKLTKIEQVVKVGTTLSRSWFRGHAKVYGELTPKLFRKQYDKLRTDSELSLIENFKRGAPALEPSIPDYEDHIAWLFLMQHHGMPTRLLDWTKSILIALYFVVSKHTSDDGELWAMYPDALNECSGFHGIPLRIKELAELLPGHHSARWPGGGRLFWSALGFGRLLSLARLKTGIELGATQVFTLSR